MSRAIWDKIHAVWRLLKSAARKTAEAVKALWRELDRLFALLFKKDAEVAAVNPHPDPEIVNPQHVDLVGHVAIDIIDNDIVHPDPVDIVVDVEVEIVDDDAMIGVEEVEEEHDEPLLLEIIRRSSVADMVEAKCRDVASNEVSRDFIEALTPFAALAVTFIGNRITRNFPVFVSCGAAAGTMVLVDAAATGFAAGVAAAEADAYEEPLHGAPHA